MSTDGIGARGAWELRVLGEFELRSEATNVTMERVQQRLLAYLALQGRTVLRKVAASALYEAATDADAAAHLRNAVWKVRRVAPEVIEATRDHVGVPPSLTVDLDRAREVTRELSTGPAAPPRPLSFTLLKHDVLPDWSEHWVVVEREQFRQSRLHALEAASRSLATVGRFQEAIDAAELAIAAEPLRESAHRALIHAHIAEGNWAEAIAQYEACCVILRDELGLGPTPALTTLVATARRPPVTLGTTSA